MAYKWRIELATRCKQMRYGCFYLKKEVFVKKLVWLLHDKVPLWWHFYIFCHHSSEERLSEVSEYIELGRWSNIPINERKWHLCHTDLGDEFHYLFKFSFSAKNETCIWNSIIGTTQTFLNWMNLWTAQSSLKTLDTFNREGNENIKSSAKHYQLISLEW